MPVIVGKVAGTGTGPGNPAEYKAIEVDANGAAHTTQVGGTWDYGSWPETQWLEFTGAAGTNDDDVIYTSPDVSAYNYHLIECTAGTVDVDVSVDGTNWVSGAAFESVVTTTPATRVVEAASGVMVQLKGKFQKIRINQKGATASNARGAHGVI